MRIEKMAALANIGALFTGLYSAYGTWRLLHPQALASAAPSVPAASGVTTPHLFLSLFVAACAVIFAAVVNVVVFIRRRNGEAVNVEPVPESIKAVDRAFGGVTGAKNLARPLC